MKAVKPNSYPKEKEGGVTGLQVKDLFKEGRYKDIARYCMADVVATKKLYQYWEKYIKFWPSYLVLILEICYILVEPIKANPGKPGDAKLQT